jgi:hypothetical protein
MMSDTPILQGVLGLKRKKGFESRFFVLFSDRLEYFKSQEESRTRDDPRGRLNLEDIQSIRFVQVGEGSGFIIHLEEQEVELCGLEDELDNQETTVNQWHEAFQNVLPSGILGDVDPPATEERGVILEGELFVVRKGNEVQRYFVLTSDCIEYYSDSAAKAAGNDPRGRVMLEDVTRFEAVTESLSVFIEAADEKRPLVLKSASKKLFNDWAGHWDMLLSGQLGDNFVVTEDASEARRANNPPADAPVVVAEPSPSPGNEAHVVIDGPISVVKKASLEARYGVLWNDRFEYFEADEQFHDGSVPRCRIPLDQFIGFEEIGSQFKLQLQDRTIITEIVGNSSLLRQWSQAWCAVGIGEEKESQKPPADARADSVASSTPRSATPRKSVGGTRFLKQGDVEIMMKNRGEARFLAVTVEQLQVYNSVQDAITGVYPRMRIVGSDIADVKPFGKAFVVELHNAQQVEFQCGTQNEVTEWVSVIKPLPKNAAAAKRAPQANAEMGEKDEPRMQGACMIVFGGVGKAQRQLFRIYNDRFEYASGAAAFEEVAEITSQPLRGVQSVERLSNNQGFIIRLEVGGTIEMRVSAKDNEPWREAWQAFMAQKALDPQASIATRIVGPATSLAKQQVAGIAGTGADSICKSSNSPRHPGSANQWLSTQRPEVDATAASKDKPSWSTACLDDSQLLAWQQVLAQMDPPLHHGLLGVQPQGQLVTGYFVLFRDRLDFWNNTVEASSGDHPKGRINLTDIRSLEMVNSGFVLNYKGQKMRLHVRNNDELHAWSDALLGALAPPQGGTSRGGGGNLSGGTAQRSNSAPPKIGKINADVLERMRKQLQEMIPNGGDKFAVFAQRNSDVISTAELARMIFKKNGAKSQMLNKTEVQDFILALTANGSDHIKVTKLINFIESGAIPSKGSSHKIVPRVARLAEEKQRIEAEQGTLGQTGIRHDLLRRRTFGGFAQEAKLPDQPAEKSFKMNTYDKHRRDGGWSWKENTVSEKVTVLEPGDEERKTVKRQLASKDHSVTEKLNGDRVLTPRMDPGDLAWIKINHCSQEIFADPERSRQNLSRSVDGNHTKIGEENRKPKQPRTCLTEKVTDPGRRPLADTDHKKAMADRMAEKVTDAGRAGVGWAAPFGEAGSDRCRSLAQRMGASQIVPVGGHPLYR